MGSASLASSKDSTSLFLNPAGISGLDHKDFYLMYNQLYAGLNGIGNIGQGLLSLGLPTRYGALGFGYGNFKAEGLLEERIFAATLAKKLSSTIDAGITTKMLSHTYLTGLDPLAAQDPVFQNGASKSALSLDAGIVASLIKPSTLKLGFAVRNINTPDVGLVSKDRVPREFLGGLAYEHTPWAARFTADVSYRDTDYGSFGDKMVPGVGFEKTLDVEKNNVKLRLGINTLEYCAGVGIQIGDIGIDYALVLRRNLLADNSGSHMLGLRFQFGGAGTRAKRGK